MSDIKQVTPLVRIWPTRKNKQNSSGKEQPAEQKKETNEDNRNEKDQPGDTPHLDEYA